MQRRNGARKGHEGCTRHHPRSVARLCAALPPGCGAARERMERRGVDDRLQGTGRDDGGALRIQVELLAAPPAAERRRQEKWACWKTAYTQRASRMLCVAPCSGDAVCWLPVQSSREWARANSHFLWATGHVSCIRCVARIPRLGSIIFAATAAVCCTEAAGSSSVGGRVGPERQATHGYVRRETLAQS